MRIFLRDPSTGSGQVRRRAVFGGREKFQNDPYWRDLIPFHDYFPRRQRRRHRREPPKGLVAKLIQQYQQ
jgi:hypothetical protein